MGKRSLKSKHLLPIYCFTGSYMRKTAVLCLFPFFLFSCMTYYQKNSKFNEYFQAGNMEEAYKYISRDVKKHRKDKLLVLLNRGMVASMLGKYAESNLFFEEAYRLADDMQKNYVTEGLALLTNPMLVSYKGESFELLFIHYYKALNFLRMNDREKALVECRRMNIELNKLESKYKSDRKFKRDAFIHLLMGVIYDVNGDINNAFIAYRNSYQIYKEDYKGLFGIEPPLQLKKDLLRTAYIMGFLTDVAFYEKEFGFSYVHAGKPDAEAIFLWQSGLGPIKSEWSINFTVMRPAPGSNNIVFVNNDLGMSYTFQMTDQQYQSSGLKDLQVIRIAFPRYIRREPVFTRGVIQVGNKQYPLELTEDVEQIAIKSLQDRMHVELGTSLLRFALKKAAELKLRQQNGDLGAALGILNAVSEKADTRYWSTLPNSIHYARIPLDEGKQELQLQTFTPTGSSRQIQYVYDVVKGTTIFETFYSLETRSPGVL